MILKTTLDAVGYDKSEWESNRSKRTPEPTMVKQMVSYIACDEGYSLTQVGNFLGVNHATVYHHKVQAKGLAEYEKDYAQKIQIIREALEGEKAILREVRLKGWVTRDEDGELTLFSAKPSRVKDTLSFWCGDDPRNLNPELYPQITWVSDPLECEVIIKPNCI